MPGTQPSDSTLHSGPHPTSSLPKYSGPPSLSLTNCTSLFAFSSAKPFLTPFPHGVSSAVYAGPSLSTLIPSGHLCCPIYLPAGPSFTSPTPLQEDLDLTLGPLARESPPPAPWKLLVPGVHLLPLAGPLSNPTTAPSYRGGNERSEVKRFARTTQGGRREAGPWAGLRRRGAGSTGLGCTTRQTDGGTDFWMSQPLGWGWKPERLLSARPGVRGSP